MGIPVAIPLSALPSQEVAITLAGQQCTINVYQKATGLFLDLYVSSAPIVQGAACLNAVFIVRDRYHGFIGDLVFGDSQGTNDPDYTGVGTRFALLWVE